MLKKVVLRLSLWMTSLDVITQMRCIEQFFPVTLFIIMYKVILTSESVDNILEHDHSNESC